MTTRTTIRALAACAAFCVLSACSQNAASGNKVGGETIVLKFASIDDANDNGQSYGPKSSSTASTHCPVGRSKSNSSSRTATARLTPRPAS